MHIKQNGYAATCGSSEDAYSSTYGSSEDAYSSTYGSSEYEYAATYVFSLYMQQEIDAVLADDIKSTENVL